jgi:hypothetical protein
MPWQSRCADSRVTEPKESSMFDPTRPIFDEMRDLAATLDPESRARLLELASEAEQRERRARRDLIREALEFYADPDRWDTPDVRTCGCRFTVFCDDETDAEHPSSPAQQALTQLPPAVR